MYNCHNNNNDLLTDPLGGSSLLNYIDYNYKINRIKIFANYTVELCSRIRGLWLNAIDCRLKET